MIVGTLLGVRDRHREIAKATATRTEPTLHTTGQPPTRLVPEVIEGRFILQPQ